MARIDTLANFLTDIANKIRSKTGSQSNITPANYDTEIEKIAFKPGHGFMFNLVPNSMGGYDTTTTSLNLKNFDTSDITNMYKMFYNMKALETLDLSKFDTRNVVNFEQFCMQCQALETINFGDNFTLSSATNLGRMFYNCGKLDNNTLNAILHLCTTATSFTGIKSLQNLGITTGDNYDNIPNLSNYQEFLDAGWTLTS